ncbi:MAG: hypothetical protein ACKOW9_00380 [Candidatus Paceibacterota bacterium]
MIREIYTGTDSAKCAIEINKVRGSFERTTSYSLPDGSSSLLESLKERSLFGRPAYFINAESVDADFVDKFLTLLSDEIDVVFKITNLSATIRKKFEKIFLIKVYDIPSTQQMKKYIHDLAGEYSVSLSNEVVDSLIDKLGDSVDRIRSVVRCCAIAKINDPSVKQVLFLSGSSSKSYQAWDVFDSAMKGDLLQTINLASTVDSFALLGFFSKRCFDLLLLSESGITSKEGAAALLDVSPWQAGLLLNIKKVKASAFEKVVREAVYCERALKTGGGREFIDVFLYESVKALNAHRS